MKPADVTAGRIGWPALTTAVCKTAGCASRVPDLLCDPCSPVILRPGAGVGSMATGATYDP